MDAVLSLAFAEIDWRLFLMALDRYWDTVVNAMMEELSDPDPRRAIQRMFDALIRRTSDPRFPRGCLITNTSLECPTCSDEIARKIAERLGQQETAVFHWVIRAVGLAWPAGVKGGTIRNHPSRVRAATFGAPLTVGSLGPGAAWKPWPMALWLLLRGGRGPGRLALSLSLRVVVPGSWEGSLRPCYLTPGIFVP